LLHRLEPGLLAPILLGPLNVPDVKHPLTHLNGLRVFHHLRKVRVDDLLVELVLGRTWEGHGDLDLSEKQPETRTEEKLAIQWSKQMGVYMKNFFFLQNKHTGGKRSWEGTRGAHKATRRAPGGRALLPWDLLVGPLGCFLFLYFF
jgi:hypothetical protein